MKALLQRVSEAAVTVGGETVGRIGPGLLVFLAVERTDTESVAQRLARRCVRYRIFPDDRQRMNSSLLDTDGQLLLVSQFTLAADTASGLRPSFTPAAAPAEAQRLYGVFCETVQAEGVVVATGRFGADMQVALVNDGPVTIWLAQD